MFQEGFFCGGCPLQGCCDQLGKSDLCWEKGVTIALQAMVPKKPGRSCARVDERGVLQKITAPPNTRNTSTCPSLPYLCSVHQLGQGKTVVPSSSSCPLPARRQDAASVFDTLQPWRALWSCRYSGVAAPYQQLPAKGIRPAGRERNGPANTEG